MKSWCTKYAVNGIETVRLCCGGQGYSAGIDGTCIGSDELFPEHTLSSGIAQILNDFLPSVTYEGVKFDKGTGETELHAIVHREETT